MINICNSSNGFSCEVGDICKVKLNSKYNAILSLFHFFGYQTSNLNVKLVFENTIYHLLKGGYFIFDVCYSPAVYMQPTKITEKKVENKNFEFLSIVEPSVDFNKNTVKVKITISKKNKKNQSIEKFDENHLIRHFSLPELKYYGK